METTPDPFVDNFLAHYGVKGMKWGVRRSDAELARASGGRKSTSSEGGSEKPKRRINKKHVAVAAGVLGVAGAVAVTAVVASNQKKVGQASVMAQMKKMSGDSTWDVLTKVNTTPSTTTKPASKKSTRAELDAQVSALKKKAGEDAVRQQIQAYSKQSVWDIMTDKPTSASTPAPQAPAKKSGIRTPAQKRRDGEEAVKQQVKEFASRSVWDLATDTSLNTPKKSAYSSRAKKNDTKLYGAKNAQRIEKQVNKGVPLSEARQGAAVRRYGGTAARVATNVGAAKLKERRR